MTMKGNRLLTVWEKDVEKVHEWLEEVMELLVTCDNMSYTRRSAGLPAIIQVRCRVPAIIQVCCCGVPAVVISVCAIF